MFRTQFNNEAIEKQIHTFIYWDEIQSQQVDIAFEMYLNGSFAQSHYPEEVKLLWQLMKKGGLLGVIIEAHEKWEVLEYLKNYYSLEDVATGRAYTEYKSIAHATARFKELMLYQYWYAESYQKKIACQESVFIRASCASNYCKRYI